MIQLFINELTSQTPTHVVTIHDAHYKRLLRDHYAGLAMQALLSPGIVIDGDKSQGYASQKCYEMAESMLVEREKVLEKASSTDVGSSEFRGSDLFQGEGPAYA